ncbi:MAG TPA: hypothetical protein VGD16_12430, partial [Enterovirga sp.]
MPRFALMALRTRRAAAPRRFLVVPLSDKPFDQHLAAVACLDGSDALALPLRTGLTLGLRVLPPFGRCARRPCLLVFSGAPDGAPGRCEAVRRWLASTAALFARLLTARASG